MKNYLILNKSSYEKKGQNQHNSKLGGLGAETKPVTKKQRNKKVGYLKGLSYVILTEISKSSDYQPSLN